MSSALIIPENITIHKSYYDKQNIITRSMEEFKIHFNLSQIRVYNNKPTEVFTSTNLYKALFTIDLPMYTPDYLKCLGTADEYCKPIEVNCVISTLDNYIHVLHHKDDDPSIIMAMIVDRYTNTCEYCGNPECTYCINPYIHDINGRDEWQYLCTDCYKQLMTEI